MIKTIITFFFLKTPEENKSWKPEFLPSLGGRWEKDPFR
jgi:hypothetical protein